MSLLANNNTSVSQTKHSQLKESIVAGPCAHIEPTNRFPLTVERPHGYSESLDQDMVERRQEMLQMSSPLLVEDDAHLASRQRHTECIVKTFVVIRRKGSRSLQWPMCQLSYIETKRPWAQGCTQSVCLRLNRASERWV